VRRARRPADDRIRLGFVGIHAGARGGQAVSQSETLAARFAASGYEVHAASTLRNPLLRTLHQLAAVLTWHVDVVVVDVFSGRSFRMAELATRAARLTGARIVLFLHGGNLPEFGPAHRARVERVLGRADLVLAPSEFLAGTFRGWGYDVHVVPNVVTGTGPAGADGAGSSEGGEGGEGGEDVGGGPRPAARPAILWMRTFHEHYDPLTAVRVLARVVATEPAARLTMAGADQGLLDATRAEATRLGVQDRVSFPGYLDEAAKQRAFATHDVFLNTNLVDNTPVSLVETSLAGLVPVAAAVGGIPMMITDGHNGVLVPAGDVDAMAAAVLDLLAEPERFAALSAAAQAFAADSTWPRVRARWERELARLVPAAERP